MFRPGWAGLTHLLSSFLISRELRKGFEDSWAVVTGSSYGIGRDVALELAKRGLHVVVHGRSKEKLETLCTEIRSKHKTQCKVIVQDVLVDPKWDVVAEQIKGLNISVLVNNVGGGTPGTKCLDWMDMLRTFCFSFLFRWLAWPVSYIFRGLSQKDSGFQFCVCPCVDKDGSSVHD